MALLPARGTKPEGSGRPVSCLLAWITRSYSSCCGHGGTKSGGSRSSEGFQKCSTMALLPAQGKQVSLVFQGEDIRSCSVESMEL
jgi:hypothetical protein